MNFLFSCNGIRIPECKKIFDCGEQVGKFNVRFIHKNKKVQSLFVDELSIEI